MSSPLSEVPDLPTQLPPTPELQTKSLPNSLPTVPSPTVNFASSSSIPAESSATAARRAVGSKSSLKVTKKLCRKRKGQALDDDLESLSGAEELKEIGDIMEDGTDGDAKKGAKKHKKSKGRDGKAARGEPCVSPLVPC